MTVRWERFAGDTSTFAVKLSFHADPDEGHGIDEDTAASWGALQVWVDGINLCSYVDQGETLQAAHWYLLPVLEWLANQWDPLLHEERLPVSSADSASFLTESPLSPALLFGTLPTHRALIEDTRRFEWGQRHSLRVARDGGILPGIHIRRLRDTIEVFWDNDDPLAGAEDVRFATDRGSSLQEPTQVASALYEVLSESVRWLGRQQPDSVHIAALASTVDQLASADRQKTQTAWLAGLGEKPDEILDRWPSVVDAAASLATSDARRAALECSFDSSADDDSELVLSGSCTASLLFGSTSPTINDDDVLRLAEFLLDHYSPDAIDGLADLAEEEPIDPHVRAWRQGYDLALGVLEDTPGIAHGGRTDIERFLEDREVAIEQIALSDTSIRAVSLVSADHSPTIALNSSSPQNASSAAQRFTLAHELCHLLADRAIGSPLAVASGPWAPRAIEQRANAFAAMLLMPPESLVTRIEQGKLDLRRLKDVRTLARELDVSASALIEHVCNLGMITETEREDLRTEIDEGR